MREKGYAVVNIDATLIAQAPKVGPYKAADGPELAQALGISPEQVNVKATTEEHLGLYRGRLRYGRSCRWFWWSKYSEHRSDAETCASSRRCFPVWNQPQKIGSPEVPSDPVFQNGSGILPYGGDLVPQISGAPAGNLFDTFPVPSHRMGGEEECSVENYLIIARSVTYAQRMQNVLGRAGSAAGSSVPPGT